MFSPVQGQALTVIKDCVFPVLVSGLCLSQLLVGSESSRLDETDCQLSLIIITATKVIITGVILCFSLLFYSFHHPSCQTMGLRQWLLILD